jgi:hypothetical protein
MHWFFFTQAFANARALSRIDDRNLNDPVPFAAVRLIGARNPPSAMMVKIG